jgi:hypothetical protein
MSDYNPEKFIHNDSDMMWSDAHFRHCWNWLLNSDQSPCKGSPAMIVHGLGIRRAKMQDWKRRFGRADPFDMAYKTRMRMTARFKRLLSGVVEVVPTKINKNGMVIGCEVRPLVHPRPLNCPAFYRGSIAIGRHGMKVVLKRTDAVMATKHNPDGIARLTNPFGVR